jgi:hypothetical protein
LSSNTQALKRVSILSSSTISMLGSVLKETQKRLDIAAMVISENQSVTTLHFDRG